MKEESTQHNSVLKKFKGKSIETIDDYIKK